MVGLTDLGELAYAVEKVHNRVIEEDRPTTPALIALIGVAESSFRRWVDALRSTGRVTPDADALRAALAKVESEFPDGGGDSGGQPPSPPPSPSRPTPGPLAAVSAIDRGADMAAPGSSHAAIEVLELDETPYGEGDMADSPPESCGADAGLCRCRGAGRTRRRCRRNACRCRRGNYRRRSHAVGRLVPHLCAKRQSSIWPRWTTSCRLCSSTPRRRRRS